jgi:hypothetical protein
LNESTADWYAGLGLEKMDRGDPIRGETVCAPFGLLSPRCIDQATNERVEHVIEHDPLPEIDSGAGETGHAEIVEVLCCLSTRGIRSQAGNIARVQKSPLAVAVGLRQRLSV